MGATVIIAAAALALAAGTGAVSFAQARAQSRAARQQRDITEASQREAQEIQLSQAARAAQDKRARRRSEAESIRSTIIAAGGESGIGFGGTFQALALQTAIDEQKDIERINETFASQVAAINQGSTQFLQQTSSPFLESVTSGLAAGAQGLTIGSNIQRLASVSSNTITPTAGKVSVK